VLADASSTVVAGLAAAPCFLSKNSVIVIWAVSSQVGVLDKLDVCVAILVIFPDYERKKSVIVRKMGGIEQPL
jgi:hypothetical protein